MARGYTPPKNAAATYTLTRPIVAWGEEVTEIGIREPLLADLRKVRGVGDMTTADGLTEKAMDLIGPLSGLTENQAGRLNVEDSLGAAAVILDFFIGGEDTTGPESTAAISDDSPPE